MFIHVSISHQMKPSVEPTMVADNPNFIDHGVCVWGDSATYGSILVVLDNVFY